MKRSNRRDERVDEEGASAPDGENGQENRNRYPDEAAASGCDAVDRGSGSIHIRLLRNAKGMQKLRPFCAARQSSRADGLPGR
jgi:hypothetical protein